MKSSDFGFTLIELLIVIALIAILAIALLSAINPIEQARKARDTARKADTSELYKAYERYRVVFECSPWGTREVCPQLVGVTNPNFNSGGNSFKLIATNELVKFQNRPSVVNNELFISELPDLDRTISVCFEPESSSWRKDGGGGPLRTRDNLSSAACSSNYPGGSCFLCVPAIR